MNTKRLQQKKQQEKKQAIVLVIVLLVVGSIVWSLPSSMRDQAQELQCKLRLKRMGDAVNYWIYENKFNGFPPVKNPKPYTLWQPNRMSSASAILRDYLGGDIPRPRHEGENAEAYAARLRNRELSVCPITGFEYWFESLSLSESDVRTAAEKPESHKQEFKYFSCQHHGTHSDPEINQTAPHLVDDQRGNFSSYGKIIRKTITQKDIDELQTQLRARESENAGKPLAEWTHDLLYLRKRVESFRQQIEEHPEGFPAITLFTSVRFKADTSTPP